MAQHPFGPGGPHPPPQYGYGQQPSYGHGQVPHQQPPGTWQAAAAARTVYGVPLAADERVIYYRHVPRSPIGTIILGIILLPFFLLGIFHLVRAAKMRKAESHAQVVTNRRVFTVNGHGEILDQLAWSEVAGLYTLRTRRGSVMKVGVHGPNSRKVIFDTWHVDPAMEFLQRVMASPKAIDSLPEANYDAAAR